LAARDFSQAGETFVDYTGEANEILYSILTPTGYSVYVTKQKLHHLDKHPVASKYKNELAYLLNNPDLVTPNHEEATTHIFYKAFPGKLLLAAPVHLKDEKRFVASLYEIPYIKGIRQHKFMERDFLYLRGGFKWKKWR
jgi:hypothetical protein